MRISMVRAQLILYTSDCVVACTVVSICTWLDYRHETQKRQESPEEGEREETQEGEKEQERDGG